MRALQQNFNKRAITLQLQEKKKKSHFNFQTYSMKFQDSISNFTWASEERY